MSLDFYTVMCVCIGFYGGYNCSGLVHQISGFSTVSVTVALRSPLGDGESDGKVFVEKKADFQMDPGQNPDPQKPYINNITLIVSK